MHADLPPFGWRIHPDSARLEAGVRRINLENSPMKSTSSLLIVFGLASSVVFAQTEQSMPQSPAASGASGASAAPGAQGAVQTRPHSPGAQPGTPPGANSSGVSGASGASGTESAVSGGAGTLGTQSGAQSGMPPHPASGASGTHPASGTGIRPPSEARPQQQQPAAGASDMQSSSSPVPGGGADPMVARLEPKQANGASYICGGVGKEEATYLKKEAAKHDLALTFAAKDGEYLADVNVAISDAKGNPVLQTRCDGPMMLVDLPRGGTYRVHAETAGYALDRTVKVSKNRGGHKVASAVLTWPTRVANIDVTGETATGSSGAGGTGASGGGRQERGGGERRW
jgi:hypothetical protein